MTALEWASGKLMEILVRGVCGCAKCRGKG